MYIDCCLSYILLLQRQKRTQVSYFVHFLLLYIFKIRNRLIEVSLYFVLLTDLHADSGTADIRKKIRLEAHKFHVNFILHLIEAN